MGGKARVTGGDIKIAKVVGENEDGLTLFVPKDMEGVFHLNEGDKFLSIVFVKSEAPGRVVSWVPWE